MTPKKIPDVKFTTDLITTSYGIGPNYHDTIAVLEAIVELAKQERDIGNVLLRAQHDVPSGWTQLKLVSVISILGNDSLRRTMLQQRSSLTERMLNTTLVLAQANCWTHA